MHCPHPPGLLRNALTITLSRLPSSRLFSRLFPEFFFNQHLPALALRPRPGFDTVWGLVALMILLFQSSAALPMGLGSIQSQSALGQPLRVIIPLTLQPGEEPGCVRVSGGSDALPAAINPRHAVLEQNQSTRLEITTAQTVNEPVLNLVVTVGCAAPITRNYVLLLDPPEIAALATTAAVAPVKASPVSRAGRNAAISVDAPATPARRAAPRPRKPKSTVRAPAPASAPAAGMTGLPNAALADRPAQAKPRVVPPPVARSASSETNTATDRLVLSSQMQGTPLRLSTAIPPVGTRAPADPEQVDQLRKQQERMAAELNEQDPFVILAAREAALASRVQRLTEEAGRLQKQIDALTVRNQSLERTRLPAYLVWILGGLALLALCVVAWFVSRYRMLQQSASGKPWWTSSNAESAQSASDTVAAEAAAAVTKRTVKEVVPKPVAPRKPAPAPSRPPARPASDTLLPLGTTTTSNTTQTNILPSAHAFELTEYDGVTSIPHGAGTAKPAHAPVPAPESKPAAPMASAPAPTMPAEPEKIDFMLDLTASEQARISNTLDFSIATQVGIPEDNDSRQSATESFFADLPTPAPSSSLPKPETPLPKLEMPASRELNPEDEGEDPTHTVPMQVPLNLEQASLHFRLAQFTSVIEQIEELRQKNDSTHAITLLRRYVLREEGVPTLMWLMLLEEYRKTNKKAVYSALSEHFSRRYGRPMLKWEESLADRTPQVALAQIPELDENIKRLWGTHKGLDLINSYISGTNQSDAIVFNALLQRELLQLVPNYPLDDSTGI